MCKAFGLVDLWRLLNPDGREYTFYSAAHQMYSRIDYYLISKSLVSFSTCSIGSIIISDHVWLCMEMFPHQERQRTYRWRFNTSLLQRSDLKEALRKEINIYEETNAANEFSAGILWEALKAVLRGYIIQYASYVKKCNSKDLANLEKEIKLRELEMMKKLHMKV